MTPGREMFVLVGGHGEKKDWGPGGRVEGSRVLAFLSQVAVVISIYSEYFQARHDHPYL